ncbi:hypothetical protein [Priestia megaterium]|uniref:hypothetical protein n=1 Tax=Priestia megaterium TaxID=1404 RepID=UPI002E212DDC|nr:hypothetical protein [Priestia megaterium]
MTKTMLFVKGTQVLRRALFTLFLGSMFVHMYHFLQPRTSGELNNEMLALPIMCLVVFTLLTVLFKDLEQKRWKKMLFYMIIIFIALHGGVTIFKMVFNSLYFGL